MSLAVSTVSQVGCESNPDSEEKGTSLSTVTCSRDAAVLGLLGIKK